MPSARSRLGAQGERIAAAHLETCGLVVSERNYRTRYGEIDLIARDGEQIVFTEVRTRRTRGLRYAGGIANSSEAGATGESRPGVHRRTQPPRDPVAHRPRRHHAQPRTAPADIRRYEFAVRGSERLTAGLTGECVCVIARPCAARARSCRGLCAPRWTPQPSRWSGACW